METQRRLPCRGKLLALSALPICVKHKAVLTQALQQNNAHIRQTITADRRKAHRIRVIWLCLARLGQPFFKEGDGLVSV